MSESLRDRIAAVVNEHYGLQFCQCGWRYDPKLDSSYADHVADAVITALGLPPTWGVPSFDNGDPIDSEGAE